MKKSVILLAAVAAACSSGSPTSEQQRVTQLESENAQLQAQLKESRANVAKLHAAMGRGVAVEEATPEQPVGAVIPQPIDPQPVTNLGGDGGGDRSTRGNHSGYIE